MNKTLLDRRILPFILLINLLWSGNVVSIKIAGDQIPPLTMATLRFMLGVTGIFIYCMARNIFLRIRGREVGLHAISGTLFALQIGLFYLGTTRTSAAHASVLIHTNLFFIAMLAHFFIPHDRLTFYKVVGLIFAFVGILILFWDHLYAPSASYTGHLLILTSAFILAAKTIYIKKLIETRHPVKVVFWQMAFGVPLLGLSSRLLNESLPATTATPVIVALLYQGVVVGAFCFVAATLLLKKYPASQMVSFSALVPLLSVLLSHLILHDPITHYLIASLGFIVVGIAMINLRELPVEEG